VLSRVKSVEKPKLGERWLLCANFHQKVKAQALGRHSFIKMYPDFGQDDVLGEIDMQPFWPKGPQQNKPYQSAWPPGHTRCLPVKILCQKLGQCFDDSI